MHTGMPIRHAARVVLALVAVASLWVPAVAQVVEANRTPTDSATLPLVPTRALRFTTDEGTWMSLDVSADGSTLVFDLLGDLYVLPVEGGAAKRITSGQAFDGQPRFSPDGGRIAFVSDRSGSDNVWVANADGSEPRQITRTEWFGYISPEWTPDGRFVIVSRNHRDRYSGPFDLFMYDVDGGGSGVRLTGTSSAGGAATPASPTAPSYIGAAFGEDPRYLYVAFGSGRFGGFQIGVHDLATGKTSTRTRATAGAVRPVLSPDGKHLVYATRHEGRTALRVRALETGDERWLAREVQRDQIESNPTRDFMPGSAFTPDGQALITSYGGKIWRLQLASGQATQIRFTAEVDQRIGERVHFDYALNDSVLDVRQIRYARPSPDGRQLAFTALDRLWLVELAGCEPRGSRCIPRRVTSFEASEHGAVWSPDGRWLAFVTWTEDGGDIYRVRIQDGRAAGAPEKLSSTPAFYEKLAFTPDGTRLLVVRGSRQQRLEHYDELVLRPSLGVDLMWLSAGPCGQAGCELNLVTPLEYLRRYNPTYYGVPHFGPDPSRIVLFDGTEGLVSMRFDGTDRRTLLKVTTTPWSRQGEDPADEILLSPTGDRAAVLAGRNVYVISIPTIVGEAPTVSLANRGAAPLPVRRLTRVGGDFIGWRADGRALHYSLGSTFFTYDLEQADSAAAESRADVRITVARDRPQGNLLLRGARLITMKGDEVIERGDILIVNNRIAAIGAQGTIAAPSGARVIEVTGKTILPGYVDIHAHMWVPWGVHRMQVWDYLANLAYGVTATRDPQTMTADILDYSDRVETGELLGPRIFATARGVFADEEIESLDHARDVLRRYSEHYRTETLKQYLVGDRKRRQWVAMAAREQRLTPTNEGGSDFKLNLTQMMDGYSGIEHSLPVWPLYQDVLQLAVQSGLTYTPTLIVAYGGPNVQDYFTTRYDMWAEPKLRTFWPRAELERRSLRWSRWVHDEEHAFPHIAREAARILEAGGRVALGAHGNVQGLGVHFEMWGYAMGGMKPHDVLRVATLYGAEGIGHGDDFGSLEAGKLADLQVLDANPLEDIRSTNTVRYVMKNGRLYDAATMDEIWPRARKLPRQWWMEADPVTVGLR